MQLALAVSRPLSRQQGHDGGVGFRQQVARGSVTTQQLIDSGYTTKPIADGFVEAGVKYITPEQAGLPHDLIEASKHDFTPRLGFAYNPHIGKRSLVVRGGYGMYYFPIPARTFSELRFNPPMTGTYRLSWNDSAYTVDALPTRSCGTLRMSSRA